MSKINQQAIMPYGNNKGLPARLDKELNNTYISVQVCQIIAGIIVLAGLICSLTGIGAIFGIPIMISAAPIYLMAQLVDNVRQATILQRYMLLEQMNIADLVHEIYHNP